MSSPNFIAAPIATRRVSPNAETIHRTPNPDCPACQAKRQHTAEEWFLHHPLAGTGSARA